MQLQRSLDGRSGLKLYAISTGSTLSRLGFKNGDLVTAIDGAAATTETFPAAQIGRAHV